MGRLPSIQTLYRIGTGPSASHTMGPHQAARRFARMLQNHPSTTNVTVTLFGSLAATGRGHMTDAAVLAGLEPHPVRLVWKPDETLPAHPNGMRFEATAADGVVLRAWECYSPGGGRIGAVDELSCADPQLYPFGTVDEILAYVQAQDLDLWSWLAQVEEPSLEPFLRRVLATMQAAVHRGLSAEGVLPGGLGLRRRAKAVLERSRQGSLERRTGALAAYALAVAEENAAGGEVCAAPTCGSCGVLPAVLHFLARRLEYDDNAIVKALGVAGLFGLAVRENASISGAEVGCQGEVGTACAMAAAGAAYLLGGTVRQIEYAAEMGLEHHLGLTCDPIAGLVQIPCIERNAMAAMRALDCAEYAILTDGNHLVSFDQVVSVMNRTGRDMPSLYRETSRGGLAALSGSAGDEDSG